jgi:hypothetical protein
MIANTNRPLGANEKVYWVLDQSISTHFAVAVELEGNATPEGWRVAIDAAQKRHSNLSLRITGTNYTDLSFDHVENCQIPLRVVLHATEQNWDGELEKEFQIPIDPNHAPLARAVLIQQPGKSIFIFLSNHSIGEGMSVTLIIRDILSALAGEELNTLAVLPSLDELVGIPLKPVGNSGSNQATLSSSALTADRAPLAPVKIKRLSLTKALTEKLIKKAKAEDTSVHGALSAAFILAKQRISPNWGEKPVRLLHPISARKALDVGDNFGLIVSMTINSYDHQPENSFWELARIAKSGLLPTQNKEWIKEDVNKTTGLFESGLNIETIKEILIGGTGHEIMLTNLGLIPFQSDFGNLKMTALWGPMVVTAHNAAQTVGIATVNGSLTFSLIGYHPSDGILEAVEQILIAACLIDEPVEIA